MLMRLITAGESHGRGLTAIIEGLPAGLAVTSECVNWQLTRRQQGYGRGNRMKIETDQVEILAGIRYGKTLGSPVTLTVENKDWKHWQTIMSLTPQNEVSENKVSQRIVKRPRPGHADLVGGIKYGQRDLRNILERSSARETTMRVAAGAIARTLLAVLGIQIYSHVTEIGGVKASKQSVSPSDLNQLETITDASPVRCLDMNASKEMINAIDKAKKAGDTLGGTFEVIVTGMPVGVGSHVHYDRKLDAKLAGALMSVQAIKGVEFGIGFEMAHLPGSQVQDEIIWDEAAGYSRKTNRLGGIEGGMSTGMPLIIHAVMKPISTLYKPLQSVDIESKETSYAAVERSDTCAVPAAAVIAENVIAWELAATICDQYYADSMDSLQASVDSARQKAREF